MSMNAARYAAGLTFEQFLHSAVKYKELLESATKRAFAPDEIVDEIVQAFVGTSSLHIVVLNEDWCIDAISTLPTLAKLTERIPEFDLRVFSRDANPDLMNTHLTQGGRSIPVAIVYDDSWTELGWWGPRPAPLQQWVRTAGLTLPKHEKYREIRTWYARDHGQTALREFAAIIQNRNILMLPVQK
jgi:hypothetical protein